MHDHGPPPVSGVHSFGPGWAALMLLAVVVAVAAAYGRAVWSMQRRGDRWPVSRSAAFAAGLTAVAIAGLLPGREFSSHVTQHLLLTMLAPLCLALGAPVTLALRTLPATSRKRLVAALHSRFVRALTKAPVVLVLEVGGLYAFYLTPLFAVAHHHPGVFLAVHIHMFLAGCLFSWYLAGRDPMPNRPGTPAALAVLFIAAAAHGILAKILYARHLPSGAGTAAEVERGAQLMYYGGDLVEILLAVAVLASWYARTGRALTRERRRLQAAVGDDVRDLAPRALRPSD